MIHSSNFEQNQLSRLLKVELTDEALEAAQVVFALVGLSQKFAVAGLLFVTPIS
jgi:hypothetical protein